jgi:carboxylate-amine ligase
MRRLPFKASALTSIGVELEFQIIDPNTYGLTSRAVDRIRNIGENAYKKKIKPEITQSMIEMNSSIHQSPTEMYQDLHSMQLFLLEQANQLGIKIAGGGTHPFQKWALQKIFPTVRFKDLSHQYRYLSKRSTVFRQHVHIGCPSAEDALYLTHALARYVTQLIAISASSPFYQGVDTGYRSARSNIFSAFPSSRVVPYLINWQEFSAYFYKIKNLGIVKTMKDFYWDIRPKPEFGTDPFTFERTTIAQDTLDTIQLIEKHINQLGNGDWIAQLITQVSNKENDAQFLKLFFRIEKSLPKVVQEQCKKWEEN